MLKTGRSRLRDCLQRNIRSLKRLQPARHIRRHRHLEAYVAATLFAAVFVLSAAHLANVGLGPFYQLSFSPAVTLACTGKLESLSIAYGVAPSPELVAVHDFLSTKRPTLGCAEVPAGSFGREPLHSLQYQTLYLIIATGLVWSVTGISWNAVFLIAGILAGAFVVGVYGICRLFLPTGWALAAAVQAALSPWQETMIPALRDYAKAPFIVGIIFFAALLVKFRADARRTALAATFAGLVAGVGFGFRTDLATAGPFFALVLVGLLLWTKLRAWRQVSVAAVLFILAFGATSIPALTAYRGGGIIGHVSLLGLTTSFNPALGLNTPVYDIGHLYLDETANQFTQSYAARSRGEPTRAALEYLGPEYNRYSLRAVLDYAMNFPADVVIRGYSSAWQIIGVDFGIPNTGSLYRLDGVRTKLLWPQIGPYAFAAALVFVGAADVLMAAYLALVLGYFGGLGALQFDLRHVFHLEFLYWLSLAIVVASVSEQLRRKRSAPCDQPAVHLGAARWIRGCAVPPACLAAAVLLLLASRAYQERHATALFERYLAAERRAMRLEEQQRGDIILLRPAAQTPNALASIVASEEPLHDGSYMVAVMDGSRCPGTILSVTATYRSNSDYRDFTRTAGVPGGGEGHIFFPVLSCPGCAEPPFEGLAVQREQRSCLVGLADVNDARALPLPLWIRLGADWRRLPLYQTRTDGFWPFRLSR